MRKRLILTSSLLIILSLSLIMACGESKSNTDTAPAKAESASAQNTKDFTLTLLDGKKLTLNDLKGKAVIIDVWDTWCPPCKKEIPHFIELYSEYKSKGLEIIGVAGGLRLEY